MWRSTRVLVHLRSDFLAHFPALHQGRIPVCWACDWQDWYNITLFMRNCLIFMAKSYLASHFGNSYDKARNLNPAQTSFGYTSWSMGKMLSLCNWRSIFLAGAWIVRKIMRRMSSAAHQSHDQAAIMVGQKIIFCNKFSVNLSTIKSLIKPIFVSHYSVWYQDILYKVWSWFLVYLWRYCRINIVPKFLAKILCQVIWCWQTHSHAHGA